MFSVSLRSLETQASVKELKWTPRTRRSTLVSKEEIDGMKEEERGKTLRAVVMQWASGQRLLITSLTSPNLREVVAVVVMLRSRVQDIVLFLITRSE